ncbi:mitochondrial carnitineacylcarnitine carrier protein [Acanthamoeba castellanii str. Neff]|uniref:Mitochondrial carnitineacylcarnitine carrier protein n=1 Tax=Acanthamoeba castellanii (strain ATCC 30010 / Neff) TaxID=1257118 RepID=L8H3R4_ACACF|nr:mitochondrial carnitineacylcarnitine carrier protein [Acanthamoeba castellanii str. Neff]ELR19061.1 mitochondrial carnitineacylcarnitine carrier protein [Acanthamoeba castellanii str. Neff]
MSAAAEKKEGVDFKGFLAGTASGVAKTEGGYGRFRGPLHCLTTTVRTEGLRALYKGAALPLFGWSLIDTVMVGAYLNTRRWLGEGAGRQLSIPEIALAGMVKARLQVQYADPTTQKYKGPIDCIRKVVKEGGVLGLYKGFWGTVYFRTFCGVYFASYEYTKREFQKRANWMTPIIMNFLCGGIAATALWSLSYPFDVIKNRMATQPDGPDRPYKSVRECVTKIYQSEGWIGFWRGFTPCMLRSFPTNGAAFVAIELVNKYL